MKRIEKQLIGRTIVAIDLRPFRARPEYPGDRSMAYDPVITLDDGVRIFFQVQETDVGEYGVQPVVNTRGRRAKRVENAGGGKP